MGLEPMTADELREKIAHYRALERMTSDERTREALADLIEIAETRLRLLTSSHVARSGT
jgi:hypothetical protein